MKAKIFICHHPSQVIMYKNFGLILKQKNKDIRTILLKISHPYFKNFDFGKYRGYFDEIIEFDFVHYRENFIKEWFKIFKFARKARNLDFSNYTEASLILENSAWLPVNILLFCLGGKAGINKIIRLAVYEKEKCEKKEARIRTFLCNLYALPFPAFKIKMLIDKKGRFSDFVYAQDKKLPGRKIKIRGFFDKMKENSIPYPFLNGKTGIERKKIIIFGDSDLAPETDVEKLKEFFRALENKYKNHELFYKPHPANRNEIMPGVKIEKYNFLGNDLNAQTILDEWGRDIKAVYSASSSSLIFSAFCGIPSYSFYRLFLKPDEIKIIDDIFTSDYLKSDFLCHIKDLNEIGKIDGLQRQFQADKYNLIADIL